MNLVFALLMGTIFATVLVKSGVASWLRKTEDVSADEEAHAFLIIGSAEAQGVLHPPVLVRQLGIAHARRQRR